MRIGRVVICALFALCQAYFPIPTVKAVGSQNIVIAQIYPGATGIATQEFVEIYNNSASPVDITGWCAYYASSNNSVTTKPGCLSAPDSSTKLWLRAGGYALFVSNEYKTAHEVTADVSFAGGMSADGGHVRLFDASGTEIDRLGWGTASNPETIASAAPSNTKSLQRKTIQTGYQDTDNNNNDFVQVMPVLHASDVYEVVTVIDLCPNIDGVQSVMPVGYLADESNNCQPDSCLNLPGLQVSVPDYYDADTNGICIEHDECDNVAGVQSVIPEDMFRSNDNDCAWDIKLIVITEILPNAFDADIGNEFIEVYNPTNQTVDLSLYSVATGIDSDKTYGFPIGATIAPGEYRAFSDSVMKFTLINTSSRVKLSAIDGSIVGDTNIYTSPGDGESWALIDNVWQYTNQPTPGAPNKPSLVEEVIVDSTDGNPSPCSVGKYRNPLTNRCRNIVSDAAVLSTCDTDQYRNPETGRCRKITTTTVTPCKDGQYRSEETNRCRNISSASTKKPCKDDQYRSEETGRCRNLPAGSSIPSAGFAIHPIKESGMAFVGWWALGGIVLLAGGYGVWEWRREIIVLLRTVLRRP